jgi:hypothetical protein
MTKFEQYVEEVTVVKVRAIVSLVVSSSLLAFSGALSFVPSAQAQGSAIISLDAPTGTEIITNGDMMTIGGWAVDPGNPATGIREVDIYLDGPPGTGTMIGQARYGLRRPDVASVTGHPEWGNSGFDLDWVPQSVSGGPHTIYVVAQTAGGAPSAATVAVNACGCSRGTTWAPVVRTIPGIGWELDTGGPGVFIVRYDDQPNGGR